MKKVYHGENVIIDGKNWVIIACENKTGLAQSCLVVNEITLEEMELFVTPSMVA